MIVAGLVFSLVRTALIVVLALVALLLARKGYTARRSSCWASRR